MKLLNKLTLIAIGLTLTTVFACTKSTNYDCTGVTSTYTNNVKPILDAKCATSGCHNDVSKAKGIDLSNYGQVKSHGSHGSFMGSMEHRSGYEAMPKGGSKLSDAELKLIGCWIENNMPQ